MKKSLIALAVLSTIAGSVAAQSSVTVYGRLDAGYAALETTTIAGVSTKTDRVTNRSFTSSRFGIMGSEDLGGGLKAGFMVEGNLATSPGTTSSSSATAFDFGRQQFLTLSNSNGTLLIGKTDAQVKNVFDGFDAGFSNNLTGAYDGMLNGADFSGSSATALIIGDRRDQLIRYTSPKFSNFDVSVGLIKNTVKDSSKDIATDDSSGYEAAATYSSGPLSGAVAHRKVTVKTVGVTATGLYVGAPSDVALTGGTSLGVAAVSKADGEISSTAFGGSYNFGPVVVFAQYFDQDSIDKLDRTKDTKEEATAIGVRIPLGKATLFASITDGSRTIGTAKTAFDGMQAGVKYDLSKRTYGYAAYGEAEKKATGGTPSKAENLAFGVVHAF